MSTNRFEHTFSACDFSANGRKIGPAALKQSICKTKEEEREKLYLGSVADMQLLFKACGSEWASPINYTSSGCLNKRTALCCEDTEVCFALFNKCLRTFTGKSLVS